MFCKICRKKVEKHNICQDCFVKTGVKIAEILGGPEKFWKLFKEFNSLPKEDIREYLDEKGMTDEKAYKGMRKLLNIPEPS